MSPKCWAVFQQHFILLTLQLILFKWEICGRHWTLWDTRTVLFHCVSRAPIVSVYMAEDIRRDVLYLSSKELRQLSGKKQQYKSIINYELSHISKYKSFSRSSFINGVKIEHKSTQLGPYWWLIFVNQKVARICFTDPWISMSYSQAHATESWSLPDESSLHHSTVFLQGP